MPARRAHKKSRHGCDQCKQRRVKCDEQSPCANCIFRELNCTFFNTHPRNPKIHSGHSPSAPLLDSGPASPPFGILSRDTVLRDLELMHKFSTETWKSLCTTEANQYDWQIALPREALKHDFLLSSMLALASLHIATTMDPAAALSYVDTALQYHNRALAPFRHALDHLSPDNCDAVLAHSVITTALGTVLPRLTPHPSDIPSVTKNIVVLFELLHGVSKIQGMSGHWFKNKLFLYEDGFWPSDTIALDNDTEQALTRLETLNDKMRSETCLEEYHINKDAIHLLRMSFERYTGSPDMVSVHAWPACVSKEFVQFVRRRLQLSLLILMHWGVLLGQFDGKLWWASGAGKELVLELSPSLRSEDRQWEDARFWPPKKLGLDRALWEASINPEA